MLIYLLKANIILALLYAFYRLMFCRDTFFNCRRITLLSIIAVSLLAPLPWLQPLTSGVLPAEATQALDIEVRLPEFIVTPITAHADSEKPDLLVMLGWIYGAGVCLLLGRIAMQMMAIARLSHRCPKACVKGVDIHVLPEGETPFSFFHQIFANPSTHSAEELDEILMHEQAHARQRHSADVLISELTCAFCWFNPFVWLLSREIRQNLEFLADRSVLAFGYDKQSYQYHLLGLTCHNKAAATIYNNFNVLPLKKRIIMMNKKRTNAIGRLKYLLFLPTALLLATACNNKTEQEVVTVRDKEGTREVVMDKEDADKLFDTSNAPEKVAADDPEIYDMVEQRPMFPGGDLAMVEYLQKNIKYPQDAQQNDKQGVVVCQFVITSEGKIGDVKVMRSVYPSLDEEAVRVIKAMPTWTPGKQDGQAVNVRFTLPVRFHLK